MTKEESDLIITEQNKSTEEILKAVAKVKSDYHELCKLKEKRIAELEKENVELIGKIAFLENDLNNAKAQIEKMKSQYDYAFNQLCELREIVCLMLSQYKNKEEIDYSTRERGEKLLKQGVYKYD